MMLLRAGALALLGLASMPWTGLRAQQQPMDFYHLTLSNQQLLLVARGLQKLPYDDAAPVLIEVQRQVTEQTPKPAETEKK